MKYTLLPDVVEIDGRATYFWQRNPEATKKAVLVLHGFMSDYRSMEPFAESLEVDKDTRVLLPDLPGFGASAVLDDKDEPSLEHYVEWAKKFIHTVAPKAGRVTLVGYSFGAYITIQLAADRPKWLHDLILITPVIRMALPVRLYSAGLDSISEFSMEAAHKLYTWRPHFDFTTYYLMKTWDLKRRSKLLKHRRDELETLRPALALHLYKTLAGIDLLDYAPEINVPVITVVAGRDNLAINTETEKFMQSLKVVGRTIHMKGAGHLIPFEEPEKLVSLINEEAANIKGS